MKKYRFEDIAINSTKKKKPVEVDKHTYLGLEHLDPGSLKVTRFGSEVAPIGEKLIMQKGDVLFGKRRAYQKKVAVAPFDGIFSAHGMVLRPKTDVVDKDFFPFFISSDYFLDEAIKISVGSLSPTINWGDLKKLEFELPCIEEQKRISKVLWAMNDAMEAYLDLIKTCDELVSAVFRDEIENAGSEKILLGDTIKYLPKSKLKARDGNLTGAFPFFTSSSEQTMWIDDYLYDDECIIVATGGKASIIYVNERFAVSSDNFIIKAKENYLTKYIYYYLLVNIDEVQHGFRGVGIQHLSKEFLNNINLPEISVDKQIEITNRIDLIFDSKQKVVTALESLKLLYKQIMYKSITRKEIKK